MSETTQKDFPFSFDFERQTRSLVRKVKNKFIESEKSAKDFFSGISDEEAFELDVVKERAKTYLASLFPNSLFIAVQVYYELHPETPKDFPISELPLDTMRALEPNEILKWVPDWKPKSGNQAQQQRLL